MLPVLDGGFRASLQGSPENELQFCFESGSFCSICHILNFDFEVPDRIKMCKTWNFGGNF
uniref:Uncharacterized protein n=1 Tax=Arundo donax TaxID=35708 RepID=A0A0A9DN83_ARUDO